MDVEVSLLLRIKDIVILECWSACRDSLLVLGYSRLHTYKRESTTGSSDSNYCTPD